MKKLFLIAAVLLTGCCGRSDVSLDLIPAPRQVERSCGEYRLPERLTVACGDSLLLAARDFLAHALPGTELAAPALGDEGDVVLALDRSLGEGAYRLRVASDGVRIAAGNYGGAISAIATLRQLAAAGGGATVPAVEIEDAPRYAWRGCMLDVARHFFTKEQVKALLLRMAEYKFNKFHWHLTDDQGWRIEIKKYPELTRVGSVRGETLIGHHHTSSEYDKTPHGGYYTQKQIREIVKYAADRYVTVIPEIELPGHAVAALTSYPWLGCKGEGYEVRRRWGISKEVFCPGKETTFEFLQNVFAEVLELFPSEFIHIGGDECPKDSWKQCPLCQERIRTEGLKDEFELQSYTVRRMEKWLREHGRKIIGWDEILEGGVSPTATVMSWRGSKGGIAAAKAGNHVIMTPNVHCYLDYYQTKTPTKEPMAIGGYVPMRKVYELDPYDQLTPGERTYILGVQGNLWTEYIATFPHLKHMLLPRLAAIAEVGWSYDRKDFDDFKHRMNSLRKCYDAAGLNYATYFFEGKDE